VRAHVLCGEVEVAVGARFQDPVVFRNAFVIGLLSQVPRQASFSPPMPGADEGEEEPVWLLCEGSHINVG